MARPGAVAVLVAHETKRIGGAMRLILHQLGKLDLQFTFSPNAVSLDSDPVQPQLVIFDPALIGTAPVPASGRGLAIVAIDSKPTPESRRHCEDSGVAAYFSAPFKMGEVLDGVRALVTQKAEGAGRVHRRVPISLRFNFSNEQTLRSAMSQDLSAGGVFLVTDAPLPIGSPVQLAAALGGQMFLEGMGVVARVVTREEAPDGRAGMGIRFEHLDAKTRELIDALLGQQVAVPGAGLADGEEHAPDEVLTPAEGDASVGTNLPDGEGPFATELAAWSEIVRRVARGATGLDVLTERGVRFDDAPDGLRNSVGNEAGDLDGLVLRRALAATLVVDTRAAALRRVRPYFSNRTAQLIRFAQEDRSALPELLARSRQLAERQHSDARVWVEKVAERLDARARALGIVFDARQVLVTPMFREVLDRFRSRLDFRPGEATDRGDVGLALPEAVEAWEMAAIMRTLSPVGGHGVEVDEALATLSVLRLLLVDPGIAPEAGQHVRLEDVLDLMDMALDFIADALGAATVREDLHTSRFEPVARGISHLGETLRAIGKDAPVGSTLRSSAGRLMVRLAGLDELLTRKEAASGVGDSARERARRKSPARPAEAPAKRRRTTRNIPMPAPPATKSQTRRIIALIAAAVLPLGAYLVVDWATGPEEVVDVAPDLKSLAPLASVRIAKLPGGDMLMGTVTPAWAGLSAADRKAAVERLWAAMPLKMLVLRNADNEIVARYDTVAGLEMLD